MQAVSDNRFMSICICLDKAQELFAVIKACHPSTTDIGIILPLL